jgi:putative two-component system response regulator
MLYSAGDALGAIELSAKASRMAGLHGHQGGRFASLNNIGISLLQLGLYEEAKSVFRQGAPVAASLPDDDPVRPWAVSTALGNLALAHFFTRDYRDALTFAEQAMEANPTATDTTSLLNLINCRMHLARLHLELGSDQLAQEQLAALQKTAAEESSLEYARWAAGLIEGLVLAFDGQASPALAKLQESLAFSRQNKRTMPDSLLALSRAYEVLGRSHEGVVHLKELFSFSRREQIARATELLATVTEKAASAGQLGMLMKLAVSAEINEDPTGRHVYRVGRLGRLLAQRLRKSEDYCDAIEMACTLHDIGKLAIPRRLTAETRAMSSAEKRLFRAHADAGAELVGKAVLPHREMAIDVIRHHHENWSGDGYPDELAGEAIPEAARICALADALDAMTHDRPYRKAMTREAALREIEQAFGSKFDPYLGPAFVELVRELAARHDDLDALLAKDAPQSPVEVARAAWEA